MGADDQLKFTIQEINQNSEHLENIIQLGDANSATLGFFPRGAFHERARAGCILGCIVPKMGCVGYLLYQISGKRSGYRAKITHLCVDKMWRGRGIARELIRHLREKTYHLYGIRVSCRRDYGLEGMWAALGFVATSERPGRSKHGSILTEWWLNYGHPDLLTALTQQKTESRICVAMDATIFYDVADDEKSDEESKESKALIADWLESQLELCLTDEINNEINRNIDDSQTRKKLRATANTFTFLPCTQEAFDEACQAIRKFFPQDMKESDASDFRQLARVVGSSIKASFFVTREPRLLAIEEEIYKEFNLFIIDPLDLIIKLDDLRREAEYQPIRLAGTNVEKKRVQSAEQELLIELFLCSETENKDNFRIKIRQFISKPKQFECFIIGRRQEEPIALIVYDRAEEHELKVPVFRFKDTKVTPTIIRHSIFQCFSTAASEQRQFTRITETHLEEQTAIALQEDYFLKTEDGWLRTNLAIAQSSADISLYISNLCREFGKGYEQYLPLAERLTDQDLVSNIELMVDIEGMLYPAKITDAEIPNFIIPIQAWWAKDLFDKELAEQVIWGAKEELALRREVVYYRSKQASGGLKAPGRILWYVSKAGSEGSSSILGAIRACSRLDEIVVGKPIDLHKRFRRLGIYSIEDVLKTAKNDFNKEIMAVKFSDTELFKKPIELKDIEQLLGRRISVRAPYKLTTEAFIMIYNVGTLTPVER